MNGTNENTPAERRPLMNRIECIGILASLAKKRALDERAITALQMGAGAVCKRHFEHYRCRARRLARGTAPTGAVEGEPAVAVGETWSVPCQVPLEDRVRYVCFKMDRLDKELHGKDAVGAFAMRVHLDGWRDILEGNPTGWEPKVKAWLSGEATEEVAGEVELIAVPDGPSEPWTEGAQG